MPKCGWPFMLQWSKILIKLFYRVILAFTSIKTSGAHNVKYEIIFGINPIEYYQFISWIHN